MSAATLERTDFIPLEDSDVPNFYAYDLENHENDSDAQRSLAAAKFSKNAVTRFFDWLEYSLNNSGYLSSPAYTVPHEWLLTHTPELEEDMANRFSNLSTEYLQADSSVLFRLYNGSDPTAKMFQAEDFASAGIKDLLDAARHFELDAPIEQINSATVQAIGATMVRAHYFELLEEHLRNEAMDKPEADIPTSLAGFQNAYRNNILASIQRTARLEQESRRQQQEQRRAHIHVITPQKTDDSQGIAA